MGYSSPSRPGGRKLISQPPHISTRDLHPAPVPVGTEHLNFLPLTELQTHGLVGTSSLSEYRLLGRIWGIEQRMS